MSHLLFAILLIFFAREFRANDRPPQTATAASRTIPLEVPTGTPLPVVLDKEVRIRKTGQPIHGKIAEPIYAFDKLVVPAGSEVTGCGDSHAGVSA